MAARDLGNFDSRFRKRDVERTLALYDAFEQKLDGQRGLARARCSGDEVQTALGKTPTQNIVEPTDSRRQLFFFFFFFFFFELNLRNHACLRSCLLAPCRSDGTAPHTVKWTFECKKTPPVTLSKTLAGDRSRVVCQSRAAHAASLRTR